MVERDLSYTLYFNCCFSTLFIRSLQSSGGDVSDPICIYIRDQDLIYILDQHQIYILHQDH